MKRINILTVLLLALAGPGTVRSQQPDNSGGGTTLMSFRVMGDVPYNEAEYSQIETHIASLGTPDAFAVHLGDIKSSSTSCSEAVYQRVAGVLLASELPVFIIPGDNEWNDCPNPGEAWGHWVTHFERFDENWAHGFNVARQAGRKDNFSFVHSEVLFVGINLVGGRVHDASEWTQRMSDDAEWVRSNFSQFGNQVSHAVVFSHAFPGGSRQQFADEFIPAAAQFGKPVLLLQGDTHSWVQDKPYTQAPNVTRIVVDSGGVPPIRVIVTDDPKNFFLFDRDPFPFPVTIDGSGTTYVQNFDAALGSEGGAVGTTLPTGWTTKNNGTTNNTITDPFPPNPAVVSGTYNAGQGGDRTLAIGQARKYQEAEIQFLAAVINNPVRAIRVLYDVEAWAADPSAVNPGEAAFDVRLDVRLGGPLSTVDFGWTSTALLSPPPGGGLIDGNDPAHRASFDSGVVEVDMPTVATVRLDFVVPTGRAAPATTGWLFGVDNVILRAVATGDTDGDGDVDLDDALTLIGNLGLVDSPQWTDANFDRDNDVDFDDALSLIGTFGLAYASQPGAPGDGTLSVHYNPLSGEIEIDGAPGAVYTSVNIKVEDDTAGNPAGFDFKTGKASWLSQSTTFTNDTATQQGFGSLQALEATFTVADVFAIGSILPPGLTEADLLDHLTVDFTQQGVFGKQTGDVIFFIP